jgi:hypothetical protein
MVKRSGFGGPKMLKMPKMPSLPKIKSIAAVKPVRSVGATSRSLGAAKPRVAKAPKPQEMPAMRRLDLEAVLCKAIAGQLAVRLRYKDDVQARDYNPYCVFISPKSRKILVYGKQTRNSADPFEQPGPHYFEVGLATSIGLTDQRFEPDILLKPYAAKGKLGTICSL